MVLLCTGTTVRIAFDMTATLLTKGGVARYTTELVSALTGLDDVEVVALKHRADAARSESERIVYGLDRELRWYGVGIGRLVRASGASLLHCPAHAAPRGVRRPVVLTIHDALVWRYPELFTRANVLHGRLLVPGAARRATRVIVSTRHVGEEIVQRLRVAPERIRVTPFGIFPRFRPTPPDRDWLDQRFALSGPYVLSVGTLEPRKNLEAVLLALPQIRAEHDVSLLVVGGRGWKTGGLERRLHETPGVVPAGHVSDDELVRLYSGAACFVFPSLAEGFGFPPLEAMACGAPVVCSDRTGLPEIVGDAALLVEPTDVEAVADAVRRVLSDEGLAGELRQRGIERARSYTWDACARATAAVYREAVEAVE
jgi:glycosyltransferase involved in cell wall biosynthesis